MSRENPYPSAFKALKERHEDEIDELRKNCPHPEKAIKITLDHSCVGAGAIHPAVHVICRNCGTMKVIFHLDPKRRKTVKKTLKAQFPSLDGSRYYKNGDDKPDERLDGYVHYDEDLE